MRTDDHDVEACKALVREAMSGVGCEVFVTTAVPLSNSPYDYNPMTCPHGTTLYMQPTSEQVMRWAEEQVR